MHVERWQINTLIITILGFAIPKWQRPLPLPTSKWGGKFKVTMWQLCKEFLSFLKQEKKWWLIPLVVILLLFAVLIIFSGSSVLAPFMYPFM